PLSRDTLSLRSLLPPLDTLVPYTTLFRSAIRIGRVASLEPVAVFGVSGLWRAPRVAACGVWRPVRQLLHRISDDLQAFGDLLIRDRKSTRLNSSHVNNSYAVFSLKRIEAR